MFREGKRGLPDSFDDLIQQRNQQICLKYIEAGGNTLQVQHSDKFDNDVSQLIKYAHDEPKFDCDIFGNLEVKYVIRT